MGFLSDLVADVRRALAGRPLDHQALHEAARERPPAHDFVAAISGRHPALIAEVKRASPSAGTIAEADPAARARAYVTGGAAAISVLTEAEHFHGSLDDLVAVHEAVDVAVLRKDFLVHPTQVAQSRAAGADTILLITACLDDDELPLMLEAARELGMEPLVEAHSDRDLDRALATDAKVVGVNARDLETLVVDVAAGLERLRRVPADRLAVFESGISEPAEVRAAVDAGASAVLVGETLMRAADPAAKIRELVGEGGP